MKCNCGYKLARKYIKGKSLIHNRNCRINKAVDKKMKTYRVWFRRYEMTSVEVEAEDEQGATDKASEMELSDKWDGEWEIAIDSVEEE